MKLQRLLKPGQTYQVFVAWGQKESFYVKVEANLADCDSTQYTCRPQDDEQILELRKRTSRTLFVPYHSIRYVEVSPAADVVEKLFG